MTKIFAYPLWLGHAGDLQDWRPIFTNQIEAVVQLAYEENIAASPRSLSIFRIPLHDSGENDLRQLQIALRTLNHLLELEIPTLVVCSAGLSRSPATVATVLGVREQKNPADVVKQIQQLIPVQINPAFWHQLASVSQALLE